METDLLAAFGDGEYRFWLPLPQVFELERACGDVSIMTLEERLRGAIGQDGAGEVVFIGGGTAMVRDIRETIRLGLIGGNQGIIDSEEREVGPLRAKQLVDLYTYPARPLAESAVLAWRILSTAIFGVRLKKKVDQEGPIKPSRSAKGK